MASLFKIKALEDLKQYQKGTIWNDRNEISILLRDLYLYINNGIQNNDINLEDIREYLDEFVRIEKRYNQIILDIISNIEGELRILNSQKEETNNKMRSKDSKILELEKDKTLMKDRFNRLENQFTDYKRQYSSGSKGELDKVRSEYNKLLDKYKQQEIENKSEISKLQIANNEKLYELKYNLEGVKKENEGMRKEYESARRDYESLKSENDLIKRRLESMPKNNEELPYVMKESKELKEVNDKLFRYKAQLKKMNDQKVISEKTNKVLKDNVIRLRKQLDDNNKKITNLENANRNSAENNRLLLENNTINRNNNRKLQSQNKKLSLELYKLKIKKSLKKSNKKKKKSSGKKKKKQKGGYNDNSVNPSEFNLMVGNLNA